MQLEIKQKSRDGRGIGRFKGLIIFVDGAKAGDKVKVRITKLAARHAQAEIVQGSS